MEEYPRKLRHPSGVWMTLEEDRVLVAAPEKAKAAADDLAKLGLVPESTGHPGATKQHGREFRRLNMSATRQWMRTDDGKPVAWKKLSKLAESQDAPIEWVSPVYRMVIKGREEFLSPLAQTLLIEVTRQAGKKGFKSILDTYGLIEDEKMSQYLGSFHRCIIKKPAKANAYTLIGKIAADTDTVANVRFETMPMFVPTAYVPNDPLYADQWDMEQINAGGTGQTGWNLEPSGPDVHAGPIGRQPRHHGG
jgi:hypothetical protein